MADPISWGDVTPLISESSCGRGRVVRQRGRFVMFRRGRHGFYQVGYACSQANARKRLADIITAIEAAEQGRRAA